jgi:hypothetical protein
MEANALHRPTRDPADAPIVSSFACFGGASQRLILTNRR